MRRALAVLVGLSLVGASGCAGADRLSQSDELAVQACDIEISDETGEATYSGYSDLTLNAYEETEEAVLSWREGAEYASSAAALDPSFEPLRQSSLTVYQLKRKAVRVWRQEEPSVESFFQVFTDADIDAHNSSLNEWNVECAALANRLNSAL